MEQDLTRVCITGTAPSWTRTPWDDLTLPIHMMNDSYQMQGVVRADEFYDIHPPNHFYFVPEPPNGAKPIVYAHTVPPGTYVRPARHLDWLATQTIPIWMHPDHATLLPASATWPSARPFPRAEIETAYGQYFTSTPAWMVAHAILRGAREVHIYGIHLSTEQEYIEQRPNFEFLCGCVLGPTKRTMTVHEGLRRYESQDGLIVLPEASPILSAKFQYAFEPSPRRFLEPMKWELHKASMKRERRIAALKRANPWRPWVSFEEPQDDGKVVTRRMLTSTLQQELWYYDALVQDWQDQLARAHAGC